MRTHCLPTWRFKWPAPGEGFKAGDVIVVDILSFGDGNNNAIYRHMLEETDNGVFTGTVAYDLLNQISVAQARHLQRHRDGRFRPGT